MTLVTPAARTVDGWDVARRAARPAAALAATATAWAVQRDLRRARTVVRLPPPTSAINVLVQPMTDACDGRQPLRLAALGDSSIAGVGADRVTDCLAVQIAQRLADAAGRPVHVRGHGVSGARTADVARTQLAALDPCDPPDVVVVVVGANDIVHATPPWRYRRDVTRLYSDLRAHLDVPVVACSLPEIRAISLVGHPLRDVAVAYGCALGVLQRRAIQRIRGVTLVDARRDAGPAFLRLPDAMAVDGFHPSTAGYRLLAESLAPAVSWACNGERV